MKTQNKSAASAKVSAPKTASTKLAQQLTTTETTTAGATIVTKKTPPTKPQITAAEVTAPPKRKTFKERLKDQNQKRPFTPIPLSVLESHIAPEYREVYDQFSKINKKREGEGLPRIPYNVQVIPSPEFIFHWCNANGLNRNRNWGHVTALGSAFRNDFDPSCTHWCLTSSRAVSNGGHSGAAFASGMFEVVDREGNFLDVIGQDGKTVIGNWGTAFSSTIGKTISSWNVFGVQDDNDEDGRSVKIPAILDKDTADSYREYYEYQGQWRVNVIIDAPDDSFLKMEDLRLNMSILDVLQSIPSISDIIAEIDLKTSQLLPIIRQAWLRCSPSGSNNYGNCSIGGKIPPKTAPARFGLFIDEIQESLVVLKKKMGGSIKFAETIPQPIQAGLLKDIILTMVLLSDENRKALADFVVSSPKFVQIVSQCQRPIGAIGWKAPSTDWMIAALVSMSRGGELPTDDMIKKSPESYRGDYWDRGIDHPTRGSLLEAYKQVARDISSAIDDEDDLYNAVVESVKNRINNAKAKAKRSA